MSHSEPYEFADHLVHLNSGQTLRVEDWWDRVAGSSWKRSDGNIAAIRYALRVDHLKLPLDDEVLYGKLLGAGMLFHVSEIKQIVTKAVVK